MLTLTGRTLDVFLLHFFTGILNRLLMPAIFILPSRHLYKISFGKNSQYAYSDDQRDKVVKEMGKGGSVKFRDIKVWEK